MLRPPTSVLRDGDSARHPERATHRRRSGPNFRVSRSGLAETAPLFQLWLRPTAELCPPPRVKTHAPRGCRFGAWAIQALHVWGPGPLGTEENLHQPSCMLDPSSRDGAWLGAARLAAAQRRPLPGGLARRCKNSRSPTPPFMQVTPEDTGAPHPAGP